MESLLGLMDPEEKLHLIDFLVFANIHDIKSNEYIWSRERGRTSTFFMLPPEPAATISIENDIMEGVIKLKIKDFVSFWHGLDDLHKERRLLADFMCVRRHMYEELAKDGIVEIIHNMSGLFRCLWIIRRLWIEKQHKSGSTGFQATATRFLNASLKGPAGMYQLFQSELFPSESSSPFFSMEPYTEESYVFLQTVVRGLIRTYLCWVALNRPVLERHYAGRRDLLKRLPSDANMPVDCFMKKLRAAAPHWRPFDRARMLDAIETNGHNSIGHNDYANELIKAFGIDRFKLIAFGEEKFCASCGRSSYVGEDSLLCCKQCVQEGVKHKARYCNVECQKAHWLEHKTEMHSGKDGKK